MQDPQDPSECIVLLGTGGPRPEPARGASALLVRAGGRNLLFDAGRGVTRALLRAGVAPEDLDAVFLTHHHFDHIGNLGDLLLSVWNAGRSRPLPVYGPNGTAAIVEALFDRVYRADIRFREREAEITGDALFPIRALFAVRDVDEGPVFADGPLRVGCARVSHGHGLGIAFDEFPCLGYRLEARGRALAISGDTVACSGLDRLAAGADTLVACCYLARAEETGFERDVISRHVILNSAAVGKVAARAGVGRLVLTHLRQKPPAMLEAVAADVAADFDGEVVLGVDGLELPLSCEGRP